MLLAYSAGFVVQLGALAINAGLLVGLIVQLRRDARTRALDETSDTQRATLDAWRVLSLSIRDAEELTKVYFGRSIITFDRAVDFYQRVNEASEHRSGSHASADEADAAVIKANEALRGFLNDADDFCQGLAVGAYDQRIADRVGGYRLARLLRRYFGFVELVRAIVDSDDAWGALDDYVLQFLGRRGELERLTWAGFVDSGTLEERKRLLNERGLPDTGVN